MEVSQRRCRRMRTGQGRWGSTCSLLGPGCPPEAVAGVEYERAAGSGSPRMGSRRERQGLPQEGAAGA